MQTLSEGELTLGKAFLKGELASKYKHIGREKSSSTKRIEAAGSNGQNGVVFSCQKVCKGQIVKD